MKPVDAEAVDRAVLENLPRLLPDFEQWVATIEDRHAAERERLEQMVERAESDHAREDRTLRAVEAKWTSYTAEDNAKADVVLPMVERQRQALSDADTRLQATQDALASVPVDAPHDRLLDFAVSLREAIRGKVAGQRNAEQVNRALVDLFGAFYVMRDADLPADIGLRAGTVQVEPSVRPEAAARLLAEAWPDAPEELPAPPMRWLAALADDDVISAHFHPSTEYRKGGLALPLIEVPAAG